MDDCLLHIFSLSLDVPISSMPKPQETLETVLPCAKLECNLLSRQVLSVLNETFEGVIKLDFLEDWKYTKKRIWSLLVQTAHVGPLKVSKFRDNVRSWLMVWLILRSSTIQGWLWKQEEILVLVNKAFQVYLFSRLYVFLCVSLGETCPFKVNIWNSFKML